MKKFSYIITDSVGIHARPAGILVKLASQYSSEITISCGEKTADAKKLFSVMLLWVLILRLALLKWLKKMKRVMI